MKATVENLIKAVKACAKAHNAEFCDWSDGDDQLGVKSESVPVVADIRMIAQAFGGGHGAVEVGWGYTTVYIDALVIDPEVDVDEKTLAMALPKGTVL